MAAVRAPARPPRFSSTTGFAGCPADLYRRWLSRRASLQMAIWPGYAAACRTSGHELTVRLVGCLCLTIAGGAAEVLGLGAVALRLWLVQRHELGIPPRLVRLL